MPKAAPLQLSFSSGELSGYFDGRIDLEEYGSGCSLLENFMPTLEGPAERRGGTRFVNEVKDSTDRCGFLKFEFNVEQSYTLEVGDQYIRFYTDHALVMNGSSPLQVSTPWAAADLFDSDGNFLLSSEQSGDILYITHKLGSYPVQKLARAGALSWTCTEFAPTGGPFIGVDPDATITVYASASTGTVTLTASSSIFTSDHVGTLFYLEQKLTDSTKAWEPGKSITANDVNKVDFRNYKAINSATTGSVQPSHTAGSQYDGTAGVQWTFLDPGYGWARITAVGGTTATATVESRIPNDAVGSGNASTRWSFSAWSDALGWPTHVAFFRARLVFARSLTRQLWMSQAGDFENFKSRDDNGEIVADAAITVEISGDDVNRIEWMKPASSLIVGTAGGEFVVSELTANEVFGPGNVKATPESSYGSRMVEPCRVGDSLLFVQRSGRKLRDFAYSISADSAGGYKSSSLSVLARHLLPKGKSLTQLAYQQEPNSIVWALRSDGLLLATTLNANQHRFGWHRHPIGGNGVVEAISVIQNPDASANELWLIVKRTIDGSVVRYVEYMEQPLDQEEDILEAFYVDCGLTYDGHIAKTLTPGSGADVTNATGITFTAGSSAFISGDVGREIRHRYQDDDDVYHTARALITGYTSSTVVTATIYSAFPDTSVIASGGWAMTVETISGLDHLEGETVDVLADGSPHDQAVVDSGAITLTRPSYYVHIGPPCPAKLKTMRLEAGAAAGTAQGRTKRIDTGVVRLLNTVGGKVGSDEDTLAELLFRGAPQLMDEPIEPFTGDKEVAWPDGQTTDAFQMYVNDQPLPATVVAFMPLVETQAR